MRHRFTAIRGAIRRHPVVVVAVVVASMIAIVGKIIGDVAWLIKPGSWAWLKTANEIMGGPIQLVWAFVLLAAIVYVSADLWWGPLVRLCTSIHEGENPKADESRLRDTKKILLKLANEGAEL